MSQIKHRKLAELDPRTKLFILIMSILSASFTPSLIYEMGLIILIALVGVHCKKIRYATFGIIGYIVFYFITVYTIANVDGSLRTMLLAFLGLIHKLYPCGMMSGLLISTTKVGEFMAAMSKLNLSKKLIVPIAIMMRYLPVIKEDFALISDAMILRGISPTIKNLSTKPLTTLECAYVPLMLSASKAADDLSIASVTRGIENPLPRTCFVEIKIRFFDILFGITFIGYFILALVWKEVIL